MLCIRARSSHYTSRARVRRSMPSHESTGHEQMEHLDAVLAAGNSLPSSRLQQKHEHTQKNSPFVDLVGIPTLGASYRGRGYFSTPDINGVNPPHRKRRCSPPSRERGRCQLQKFLVTRRRTLVESPTGARTADMPSTHRRGFVVSF